METAHPQTRTITTGDPGTDYGLAMTGPLLEWQLESKEDMESSTSKFSAA